MTEQELKKAFQINSDELLLLVYETKLEEDYYIMPDGSKSSIRMTDETKGRRDSHKTFNSSVGKVLAIGRDCFANVKYFPNGATCKVGEYIIFKPGQASIHKSKDGTVVGFIQDIAAGKVIKKEYAKNFDMVI